MTKLTRAQQRILDFLRSESDAGRPVPTHREIAEHFGFRSSRAAACHLEALKRKGFLISDVGKARSLRLVSQFAKPRAHVAEIPLFGSIPAGFAQNREQQAEGCVAVDIESIGFKPGPNTFAVKVTGDSMVGRHILDGDIVVVEYGPEPRPGQVVVALIDHKSTLKTFVVKNHKPFLKAENPNYPNLIPSEELMIQGVFRALIRKT